MERLKKYLADEELTQLEFAKSCGVSQPTVWGWLSGDSSPSVDSLKVISAVTGLSVDELLDQPVARSTSHRTRTRVA